LFSFEFTTIRMIALLCNIAVVSGSIWIFYKNGFLKISKILPLILLSVPFAFVFKKIVIYSPIKPHFV